MHRYQCVPEIYMKQNVIVIGNIVKVVKVYHGYKDVLFFSNQKILKSGVMSNL